MPTPRKLPLLIATAALAATAGTAVAAETVSGGGTVQPGVAGVDVVRPPLHVDRGMNNVPVGVRFTAKAKNVRAVVVTLRKVGGNHLVHQGKRTFKPGQSGTLLTGRLTAK